MAHVGGFEENGQKDQQDVEVWRNTERKFVEMLVLKRLIERMTNVDFYFTLADRISAGTTGAFSTKGQRYGKNSRGRKAKGLKLLARALQ